MMGNHFSIILLPTNKCNVNCEYCFEDKTDDRMSLDQLSTVMSKVFDYMDESSIRGLTIHWQGGEIMTMPLEWFEGAHDLIQNAAVTRGKVVEHGLQSNLIGYHARWNNLIQEMFGNAVGTSMDYPNVHRKLFNGSASDYTRIWKYNVQSALSAGINIGVIAVPNQSTLDVGAEEFYSYFVDEIGVKSFQVNTPFPGGEENDTKKTLGLDIEQLGQFFVDLTDVWLERGYNRGVSVGPVDELVQRFTDGGGCLPCIWQSNCADEFISIDARGFVAQCDCWVTSYPEYFFGNIYENDSLGKMLLESSARRRFVERPGVVIPKDCIRCDYLSICHGGCPVRTYTFSGTMFEKDPYCGVYLSIFRKAEEAAAKLAQARALNKQAQTGSVSVSQRKQIPEDTLITNLPILPSRLVQIERRH
ncbi:MAG: SPASM domain-containing protein [Blastocatellia bacterium]|nr:MAG: SPASM domain-containing protein [Blastocatellia bacterium]